MFNVKKTQLVLATSVIATLGLAGCSSNQSADSSTSDDAGLVSMKDDKQQQNIGADQSAVYNTTGSDSDTESTTEYQQADANAWQPAADNEAPTSPISQTITFELDSAELTEEAKSTLRSSLEDSSEITMEAEIVGYTDSTGPEQYNQSLSERRAQAVRDYISSQLDADINDWQVEGRGEQSPTASNDSEWGRAQNRRVSITLTPTEQQAQQTDF